jgi:hypothetical protein
MSLELSNLWSGSGYLPSVVAFHFSSSYLFLAVCFGRPPASEPSPVQPFFFAVLICRCFCRISVFSCTLSCMIGFQSHHPFLLLQAICSCYLPYLSFLLMLVSFLFHIIGLLQTASNILARTLGLDPKWLQKLSRFAFFLAGQILLFL